MKITLDHRLFVQTINGSKEFADSHDAHLDAIIINENLEPLIDNHYMNGKFPELSYQPYKGRIRTWLCGVRLHYTDKLDVYHPLLCLSPGVRPYGNLDPKHKVSKTAEPPAEMNW